MGAAFRREVFVRRVAESMLEAEKKRLVTEVQQRTLAEEKAREAIASRSHFFAKMVSELKTDMGDDWRGLRVYWMCMYPPCRVTNFVRRCTPS